ncbi:MAG: methyltransferase family protein [Candidatus Binataceae bacterium]
MFRVKPIAGIILGTAIFAALLFIPARTIDWPRAWIFLGLVLVGAALATFAISEDLLDERFKLPLQRTQPLADKIVLLAFIAAFIGTIILIPLDVFRFHLMGPPARLISLFGLLLFSAGWWLISAAMIANEFAAPVVKHQKERGHHVIDRGPYRIVRHPMYCGVIPILIGMALWFGSYAAALAATVPIALRAMIEEKYLRRELPGYEEYLTRIRYRLIPLVW